MPIMTDAQRAALAARLAQPDCAGLDDRAACDVLNAQPMAPNPTPQGRVPNPAKPDPFALIGLLSTQSLTNLEAAGMIGPVDAAVLAGDTATLAGWIRYAAARGKITADETAAVQAALAATPATIPDPDWPATVHGPSWGNSWAPGVEFARPGGGSVVDQITVSMVAEARGA